MWIAIVASVLAVFPFTARAANDWRLGKTWENEVTASLYSVNTLTTGSKVIDYHPVLVISCRAGRYPVWRLGVRVRNAISANAGSVTIRIAYDGGDRISEEWRPTEKNRAFERDGAEGVSRLLRARQFKVEWSFGLFAGRGQAIFNLEKIGAAVERVAGDCGVPTP